MHTSIEKKQEAIEAVYFLSDLIGTKVLNGDEKIGNSGISSLLNMGKLPVVTHFIVHRPLWP